MLNHCENCNQMTNHGCLKCKSDKDSTVEVHCLSIDCPERTGGKCNGLEIVQRRFAEHYKWLERIDELVNNDFCDSMEVVASDDGIISQEEAKRMAEILAKVYSYSHRIHCEACAKKEV